MIHHRNYYRGGDSRFIGIGGPFIGGLLGGFLGSALLGPGLGFGLDRFILHILYPHHFTRMADSVVTLIFTNSTY